MKNRLEKEFKDKPNKEDYSTISFKYKFAPNLLKPEDRRYIQELISKLNKIEKEKNSRLSYSLQHIDIAKEKSKSGPPASGKTEYEEPFTPGQIISEKPKRNKEEVPENKDEV